VSATGTTQGTAATTGGNTLYDWKHLNSSNIKVFTPGGSVDVVANLKGQDSDTNILASPRIRVKQHEKAKIHIGDRVPIITNTVTPVQTGSPVVTGTVQYIDVGLKLEVEPDIHSDGEVGIKTSLEVSSISNSITNASSGSVAYQIGTRNTNTVLKLKDGETQVLAGLINEQEMKSVVKIPGLGDIPVMGRLFSSNSTDKKKTEIILAITPHILKNVQQPDAELSLYWSGTEAAVRAKPITTEKMKSVKINTSPATGAEATPSPVMSNQPQMLPGRLGVRPMVPPAPIPTRPGEVSGVAPPTPLAPASAAASPSRDDQGAPESEVSPQPAAQPAAPEGAAPPVDKKTTTESNAKPLATQSLPQNDLGSSGMSDAVLYSPKAK
jgi:general secretion pathway protein D